MSKELVHLDSCPLYICHKKSPELCICDTYDDGDLVGLENLEIYIRDSVGEANDE